MEWIEIEPKMTQPSVNMDTEHDERLPQPTASKAIEKRANAKVRNLTTMRSGWISRKPDNL